MSRLPSLRLWTLALVVGLLPPAAAHHPNRPLAARGSCPPQLLALLREGGSVSCRPSGDHALLVTVRAPNPRVGSPCQDVRYERVDFVVTGRDVSARFVAFGGLSQGELSLTPDQAKLIGTWDAYVAEAQLGTYESDLDRGGLTCRLNPTLHFDCPTAHVLDRLCLVWEPKAQPTGRAIPHT